MLIKKPYLMIFWFPSLLVAMSSVRFAEIGIYGLIKYVQLGLVLLGLFYLYYLCLHLICFILT